MKIGLYHLKYAARKLIAWALPYVENVNPNTISILMLPVGAAVAISSYLGFKHFPELLLVSVILCILRMFLGTLDGLMAVHFNKQSPEGEILNRLTPELCDMMYLIAIILAKPELNVVGLFVIGLAWLTSFSGLLGLFVARPIQSVGPVGQTDRLAAFMIILLLQYVDSSTNFIQIFMWWCLGGGIITVAFRLWRTFNVSTKP